MSLAAAVSALGLPPPMLSAYSNRLCLTGLEYETLPLSMKVIFLTPQPMRLRASWQPRVPEPKSRQLVP